MKKGWIVAIIIVAVVLVLSSGRLNKYSYANGRDYTAGNAKISDKVGDIEINWVAGMVNIVRHDGDDIILTEETNRKLPEKKQMHWLLDGKTLRVQYIASGALSTTNMKKDLTVMLPKDLSLDNMSINVVSATVEVESLQADKLKINTVSGRVDAVCGRVNEVDANTVSGALCLTFNRAPEKITAGSVSGAVNIVLPEDAGFRAELDSVSGAVKSSFAMERKDKDLYVCGDESCRIDVNTVSGDLYIDELK